jgi:hypothetical protein
MKFITRKSVWQLLGLLVIDGAVFGSTNTGGVPSFMLVVGFILLMVTFYYLIRGLLVLARLYGLSVRRKYRLAGSLTALIGFLVALQSIGELNSRDVVVLLPIVVIGYAYSFYGTAGTRAGNLDT